MKTMRVKRTERGWAGHYICCSHCLFRRNTLLECGPQKIVVTSVGAYRLNGKIHEIAAGRYFETMAFHVDETDIRYQDADVTKPVSFKSPWFLAEIDADDRANDMHEAVVTELTNQLKAGVAL